MAHQTCPIRSLKGEKPAVTETSVITIRVTKFADASTSKLPSEYDSPDQHLRTPKPPGDDWPSLTARECLELVQEVVDVARHESKQKLGHAGDGAKPLKLTVDLNEKRIAHLPNEAVAHIKPDVER